MPGNAFARHQGMRMWGVATQHGAPGAMCALQDRANVWCAAREGAAIVRRRQHAAGSRLGGGAGGTHRWVSDVIYTTLGLLRWNSCIVLFSSCVSGDRA